MSPYFSDLKLAIRNLSRSPWFTAVGVLMLALGIGGATAMFSIVEGIFMRPLAFAKAERLMVVSDDIRSETGEDDGEPGVTAADVGYYSRETQSFESLGSYETAFFELSGDGNPAQINAARVSGTLFPTLGVQPLLGRVFTQQETEQQELAVVMSYFTWQARFNGQPDILGKKIILNRRPYVIVGVMPRDFQFPLNPGHGNRTELWVPLILEPNERDMLTAWAIWKYQMVGRLKPGATQAEAMTDVGSVAKQMMRDGPPFMAKFRIHPIVRPLHESVVEEARPLVWTLSLAVAAVLMIACANLSGLLLTRAIRRRQDVALRLALGARATTLLRQAILEAMTLAVTGGLLGLGLAATTLRVLVSLLPETFPLADTISLDWQVVVFELGLVVLTGVTCGLVPVIVALRTNVNDALKQGGRSGALAGGHSRMSSTLVIAEIGFTMVLLTASGLLLCSFEKMQRAELGFEPDHTLVAAYALPKEEYGTQAAVDAFNKEILHRLRAMPGITKAGLTSFLPIYSSDQGGFIAEGSPSAANGNLHDFATQSDVSGDYFDAAGIPLIRGRLFTEADNAGGQPVVIVNRKLAEESWPGQNPIGKRLRGGMQGVPSTWRTVIGEVANVKETSPVYPATEQYYVPSVQVKPIVSSNALYDSERYIVLRTTIAPEQLENMLFRTVHSMDSQLPLTQVQTMVQAVSTSEAPRRRGTAVVSLFAALAVLLTVSGIYSVVAFSVALRRREIAIRMALGSQRLGMIRLVISSGARLAFIGCVIGLLGSVLVSRLLESFLFEVRVFDPLVITVASSFVLILALAASLLPAVRAASIDLVQALRGD
jgi:putative ABC transport system permease protein